MIKAPGSLPDLLIMLFLIIIVLGLYFLPAIAARKKTFGTQVFLLNLLLGWTLLGWVIALVWAAKHEEPKTSKPLTLKAHLKTEYKR